MPPIQVMIKPASGNCNMRCKYCFYKDISEKRENPSYGMMSRETLCNIVKKVLLYAELECSFVFQGGEPTLVGIGFYEYLIDLVKTYNIHGLKVNYALQTNGYATNEEWARFFGENNFLIGLSLDGTKRNHDLNRINIQGEGTFLNVLKAADLFKKHKVDFNILTVVTKDTANNISAIYQAYKKYGFNYQQYIPCLDPLGEERGKNEYSLNPTDYGMFLKELFDLWYQDVMKGEYSSIRYFDNLLTMLQGYPPESCSMRGKCSEQTVIEADGSVYPCDFYVLDAYRIGNLNEDTFEDINKKREKSGFIQTSMQINEDCLKCKWSSICRGGCRRDREPVSGDQMLKSYFCSAYQVFFPYAIERLIKINRANQQN